ncbi:MAG TPA: flagellar basal body rod protein FlgB, partial [Bacillota bacterium]
MRTAWFGDRALWALEQALHGVAARQAAITQNVAHVETPGYIRQDVRFREALHAALAGPSQRLPLGRSDERHLPGLRDGLVAAVEPQPVLDPAAATRADGNTVSLDQEMALLAANALEYQVLARQLSMRLGALRMVISEGRR